MSADPYHAVQREIQSSLQAVSTLRASYLRIKGMAREDSEELIWARNELKGTLATLEADLEDLDESVKIVESTGPRLFGLEDAEVTKRRQYVAHVRKEIEKFKAEVSGITSKGPPLPTYSAPSSGDDDQAEWAREEQQMMIEQQDRTMDTIAGTLSTIAQQAGLMGQEIAEHNEMLDDLEENVDKTDNKLSNAMRRMRKLIRETEETKSGWCIVILTIILIILLLTVILV